MTLASLKADAARIARATRKQWEMGGRGGADKKLRKIEAHGRKDAKVDLDAHSARRLHFVLRNSAMTQAELAEFLHRNREWVADRIAELIKAGKVQIVRDGYSMAYTWKKDGKNG